MKKIPTLFERIYEGHRIVGITPKVTPGMEWVLNGEGIATVKWDGACCAIINGELYRRYDAKKGKIPPNGAIPCCEPDPITGHWPHWIKCDRNNPADKWFWEAYEKEVRISFMLAGKEPSDGTYEAVGKHFNGNPYGLEFDSLIKHGGGLHPKVPRDFEGIRDFLKETLIEGIVFWKDGEPQCKIKRSDFGFEWGENNERE